MRPITPKFLIGPPILVGQARSRHLTSRHHSSFIYDNSSDTKTWVIVC